MSYGPPPGFQPPPFGYGPPPGAPPPPNPMNPGYPPPQMHPGNNPLAVASLVTGILAIVPGCCCSLLGMPLAIMAAVMGFVAMNQINQSQGTQGGKGLAIAGLVCGGSGIGIHVLNLAFSFSSSMMRSIHI